MPSSSGPDISVVVTAHHEGRLAHRTMRSVWNAVEQAQSRGIDCEVILVLDRPNAATSDFFARNAGRAQIHTVDFGDVGPARNFGVRQASGRYVSFLDGDDLYSPGWLYRAFAAAQQSMTRCVFNPLYGIVFDMEQAILRHLSTGDPSFRSENLLQFNPWAPSLFAARSLLQCYPFHDCARGSGYGYEDWHWYCEVVADGVEICPVPNTVWFYRRRPGTRLTEHTSGETVLRASRLFDWSVLRKRVLEETARRPLSFPQSTPAPAVTVPPPPPVTAEPVKPSSKNHQIVRRFLPDRIRRCVRAVGRLGFPWRLRHALRRRLNMLPAPATSVSTQPSPPAVAPPPQLPPPPPELPSWLIEEWKDAHALDPALFPTMEHVNQAPRYFYDEYAQAALGKAFLDLCERLPDPISHLILAPWLRTGGSDLETINYVRALVDGGLEQGMVVATTSAIDSPWARRLPPGVAFLEFGKLYGHLDEPQQRQLLVRFILQKQPQVVHNINSMLGYNMFIKHGLPLKEASQLYNHVFCDDKTTDGQQVGYNSRFVPKCFDVLTALLSDNRTELDRLKVIFGLDAEKLIAHYQPVELRPQMRAFEQLASKEKVEVLWAGRLDRQKRPDLLVRIARRCLDYPFRFHVYGAPLLEGHHAEIPHGDNIVYHGPFDGFHSLPTNSFDVFLYTSEYDGLPNALLEAMAVSLPVIASDVGGVAELVIPGETGFLASPFEDVDRYVEALLDIYLGRVDVGQMVQNAHRLLEERHSWEAFTNAIRATPHYTTATPIQDRKAA